MFDWCQNLQLHDSHEVACPPTNNSSLSMTHQYPKFAMTSSKKPRILQSENKRGIKTHFNKSVKQHRSTQATLSIQTARTLVDGCTQTSILIIPNTKTSEIICKDARHSTAIQTVPNGQITNFSNSELSNSKQKNPSCKIQIIKQTKASNCLLQTNYRDNYNSNVGNLLKNIESCHTSQHNQLFKTSQYQKSDRRSFELALTDKQNEQAAVQSNHYDQTYIQEAGRPTLKSIYCHSIRNVESQFKITQKKQPEQRYRHTPNRKILFRDRETIVSRENSNSRREDQSYRVDQSILCEPSIRELFTPIGHPHYSNNYTLSLAKENLTGVLVSIAQIKTCHMDKISEELFVYHEMVEGRHKFKGILPLLQTQMDHGSYLLIKQPFTETLSTFLSRNDRNAVPCIIDQLQTTLQQLQNGGFYLRQPLKIDDIVMTFQEAKIHNLGLFCMDRSSRIQFSWVINHIKQQMLQLCGCD